MKDFLTPKTPEGEPDFVKDSALIKDFRREVVTPNEEEELYSLRKKIELKFGSWHNFARLVGAEALRGKTPKEIDVLATRLERTASGGGIPPEKLKLPQRAINASGGVIAFCRENRDFPEQTVFQILAGKRKRMSTGVKRLFAHFGI